VTSIGISAVGSTELSKFLTETHLREVLNFIHSI